MARRMRRALAALVVVVEAQQERGQAVPALAVELADTIRFEILPREEVPTGEVAAPVFVKLRRARIGPVRSAESDVGGRALAELVRWLGDDDTRRAFLHAGAPFARTWWREVAQWAMTDPQASPAPSPSSDPVVAPTGPKFEWSTPSHFARRLFECLEWHWIETGQPRKCARRGAYAVAAALMGLEPDSVRKLAYAPSKRGTGHVPKIPPRTGLHLAPQLKGDEGEHLRQHGHQLAAMLSVELRALAAEIGPQVFNVHMKHAITEAAAGRLDLPPWLHALAELPTDSVG